MSKEKFLRLYVKISVVIGLLLFIWMLVFTNEFPNVFNGTIEKNIFGIVLNNSFIEPIFILNTPLIIFLSFFLLNLFFIFRVGNVDEVENKWLREVLSYNILLTVMMVIGQILFVIMLPEGIQGEVADKFLWIEMDIQYDVSVNVINVNYVLTLVLIIYNIFVGIKSAPPVVEVDEESIDLEEIYSLNEEETKEAE